PGTLDAFPATCMTSLRVDPAQKALLARLVREFPSVTVLELEQLLAQIRAVVQQAATAVQLVLLFVLAAALAVLYAALAASLDERLHEGALRRAFGARRAQLRRDQIAEFATLGAIAGVVAALGTEIVAHVLYT